MLGEAGPFMGYRITWEPRTLRVAMPQLRVTTWEPLVLVCWFLYCVSVVALVDTPVV